MWISRKKWIMMCEAISKNTKDIEAIKKCHGSEIKNITNWSSRCCFDMVEEINHKNVIKASTDIISDVTFDELAKYVLDGTPIERDKTVKVKYYKGGK